MPKTISLMLALVIAATISNQSMAARPPKATGIPPKNNVTVSVENPMDPDATLVITGDDVGNFVAYIRIGTLHIVLGLFGTTVNGAKFAVFDNAIRDLRIFMGDGSDVVMIVTAPPLDEFIADGGDGDADHLLGALQINAETVTVQNFEIIFPPLP